MESISKTWESGFGVANVQIENTDHTNLQKCEIVNINKLSGSEIKKFKFVIKKQLLPCRFFCQDRLNLNYCYSFLLYLSQFLCAKLAAFPFLKRGDSVLHITLYSDGICSGTCDRNAERILMSVPRKRTALGEHCVAATPVCRST